MLFLLGNIVFAQGESQEKEPPGMLQARQTPGIRGYTYNLKRLLEQMEENVRRVDSEIKEGEIRTRNEEKESRVLGHFEKGNALYKKGKLKEADKQWQRALEISRDPEMKGYIKTAEKRAKEEDVARKKEEQERQRRLEAEQKEKERRLNEQAKVFYDQAVSLYNSGDYEQAQVKFEQATQVVPHYFRAGDYLRRIPEDIRKEKEKRELERWRRLKEQQEAEQARKDKVNSIYKEATSLYNRDRFDDAKSLLTQILELDPTHQKARDYLENRIPCRIEKLREAEQKEKERRLRDKKAAEDKKQKEEKRRLEAEKEVLRSVKKGREKIRKQLKEKKSLEREIQGKLSRM